MYVFPSYDILLLNYALNRITVGWLGRRNTFPAINLAVRPSVNLICRSVLYNTAQSLCGVRASARLVSSIISQPARLTRPEE
jgi:hypothetical protein